MLRAHLIQAKLTINQPGDEYEQEADRVADQVMRMELPEAAGRPRDLHRQDSLLQRKCAECEEEEKQLQRKEAPAGTEVAPPIVDDVLRSPGQPLDAATRAFFEPRFGHDSSQVRVHTDAKAAESARAVNALAYTVGRDVVFGAGQYAAGATTGQQLIAHELTHTVQQNPGMGRAPDGLTIKPAGDHLEHEADRIAGQVTREHAECATDESPPLDGHDSSRLHIHADARAAESVPAVNALTYTVGHNIVFGAWQYPPGTRKGHRLLAPELAHVTQPEAAGNGVGYGLFRKKGEGKPQPPPKTKGPPPTTAATPCLPKFKSLKAEITRSVGVREVNGRCELILGTPGKTNGATFTSKVDVPAGCTGTLQYVQLIDMCRGLHLTSGKDIRRKTGGDWIDTQDPIDQQQVSSSGSVEFKSNDSPGQPVVESVERVQAIDSFKTWLMWKPDQPADADRVPLAMVKWNWSAEAKVKKPDERDCAKRWAVTKQKTAGGTGKATKDSPSATKTVTSSDPPTEEGKC
jgi:hypothetical protein